jgi:hypothetical protein
VPTLRGIQGLRRSPASGARQSAEKPAWGNPQRFLVVGMLIFVLATLAAGIVYWQTPPARYKTPSEIREMVGKKTTLQRIQYFHDNLLSGIELREREELQAPHERAMLGEVVLGGIGAIGVVLAVVGGVGLVRKR